MSNELEDDETGVELVKSRPVHVIENGKTINQNCKKRQNFTHKRQCSNGPDRGYSWFVVLACAIVYCMGLGTLRSSGVLYLEFMQTFRVSREKASWATTLCAAFMQLSSPLTCLLTQWFSFRKVCFLGAILSALGNACCFFATNLVWVNIFYGVIQGIGYGILFTVIPVRLTQYFSRYRVTAMGLALSGASISTFFLPSFFQYLLEEYSLQGLFLIYGGVLLNALVACALLRDPEWLENQDEESKESETLLANLYVECQSATSPDVIRELSRKSSRSSKISIDSKLGDALQDDVPQIDARTADQAIVKTEPETIQNCLTNHTKGTSKNSEQFSSEQDVSSSVRVSHVKIGSMLHGSTSNDQVQFKQNGTLHGNLERPKNVYFELLCFVASVLRKPMFYLIAGTFNLLITSMQTFYMVIIDFARDRNITEVESLKALSVLAVGDIIGRTCFGWVTDRKYLTKTQFVIINMTALAVALVLLPSVKNILGMCAFSVVLGVTVGLLLPIFVELQVEHLGDEKLSLLLGTTNFFNGLFTFVRSPVVGAFRDNLNSYDWLFYTLGILCFAHASAWVVEGFRNRKKTKNIPENSQVIND